MTEEFRTYDGSHNNLEHPEWGRAGEALLRLAPAAYVGGRDVPPRQNLRSPRDISNRVCTETEPPIPSKAGLSDVMWAWGQFLDHELDLTPETEEQFPICIPEDDPTAPAGMTSMGFKRSRILPNSGKSARQPRQQPNALSAFIDGVNVYGPDETRATALRERVGGRLKTSSGDLLPFNTAGLPNAKEGPAPDDALFVAGDIRANEHAVLASMHTLFLREHNRICAVIQTAEPDWTDEEIYQAARRFVAGAMQVITYKEFLPKLLGDDAIPAYDGYDSSVNPGISNLFSTASYRLGHSMLPTAITVADGSQMDLAELFFRPSLVVEHGPDFFLGGLYRQVMREIDVQATDAVRNVLFSNVRGGELRDLAALNIQRGRDHGLPGFNACRMALGLPPHRRFADVSSVPRVVQRLEDAYDHVDDIDPWVGGLAEDAVEGACVGELIRAVLADQFQRVRDGDRFYYENDPFFINHPQLRTILESVTLANVIRANTGLTDVPDDVFVAAPSA